MQRTNTLPAMPPIPGAPPVPKPKRLRKIVLGIVVSLVLVGVGCAIGGTEGTPTAAAPAPIEAPEEGNGGDGDLSYDPDEVNGQSLGSKDGTYRRTSFDLNLFTHGMNTSTLIGSVRAR